MNYTYFAAKTKNSIPFWLGTKRALVIVVQKNNLFGSDARKIIPKIKDFHAKPARAQWPRTKL